ncbi:hypothetical protein IWQ61_008173, partial [Dispira simplex]
MLLGLTLGGSLYMLWLHATTIDVSLLSPFFLSYLFQSVVFALAIVLSNYEHTRIRGSSGTLLMFYLVFTLLNLVRLRTWNLVNPHPSDSHGTWVLVGTTVTNSLAFAVELWPKPSHQYMLADEDLDYDCPEEEANIFSRITFSWMSSLLALGYQRVLTLDDMWDLPRDVQTKPVSDRFQRFWKREQSKSKPSLVKASIYTFGGPFALAAIFKLGQDILAFVQPQLLGHLLRFIQGYTTEERQPNANGYFIALSMFFTAVLQTGFLHQYFQLCMMTGLRVRAGLVTAIYRKALTLSNSARQQFTVGEIVNRMSVDAQRLSDLTTYLHIIWSGFFQVSMCLYLLFNTLGWSAFAGVVVMILSIPINGVMAGRMRNLQKKQMKNKDARIKLMDEILNGIKVIKLYAWEKAFLNRVHDVRNGRELRTLRDYAKLSAFQSYVRRTQYYPVAKDKASQSIGSADCMPEVNPVMVEIKGGQFTWLDDQLTPTLDNIDLVCRKGELMAIIVMLKNGCIAEQGEYQTLMERNGDLTRLIREFGEPSESETVTPAASTTISEGSTPEASTRNSPSLTPDLRSSRSREQLLGTSPSHSYYQDDTPIDPHDAEPVGCLGESEESSKLSKPLIETCGRSLRRPSLVSIGEHQRRKQGLGGEHNLMTVEESARGQVKWDVYRAYAKACSPQALAFYVLAVVLMNFANVGGSVWLKYWSNANDNAGPEGTPYNLFYLSVYGALGLISSLAAMVVSIVLWIFCAIRAARTTHDTILTDDPNQYEHNADHQRHWNPEVIRFQDSPVKNLRTSRKPRGESSRGEAQEGSAPYGSSVHRTPSCRMPNTIGEISGSSFGEPTTVDYDDAADEYNRLDNTFTRKSDKGRQTSNNYGRNLEEGGVLYEIREHLAQRISNAGPVPFKELGICWDNLSVKVPRTPEEFERSFRQSLSYSRLQERIREYWAELEENRPDQQFRSRVQQLKMGASKSYRQKSPYQTTYGFQVIACLQREWLITLGNPGLLIFRILYISCMAVIVGSLFYKLPDTSEGAFTRGGVLFFALLFNTLVANSEIPKSFGARSIIYKQKSFAFYHPSAVYIAQQLMDIPITIVQVAIFSGILYWMSGLQSNAGKFMIFWFILLMNCLCLTSMFRLIGNACPDLDTAHMVAGVMLLLFILMTGYLIPPRSMRGYILWIYWINPIAYGLKALVSNEFSGLVMRCAGSNLVPRGFPKYNNLANQVCTLPGARPGSDIIRGEDYIYQSFGFNWHQKWVDIVAVIAFYLFYIFLALVVMETIEWGHSGYSTNVFKRSHRFKFRCKRHTSAFHPTVGPSNEQASQTAPASQRGDQAKTDTTDPTRQEKLGARRGKGTIDWPQVWRNSAQARTERERVANLVVQVQEEAKDHQNISADDRKEFALNYFGQCRYVLQRIFVSYWRDPNYNMNRILLQTFNGFIVGVTFVQLTDSTTDLQNRVFAIFQTSVLGILVINQVEPQLIKYRTWFTREEASGFYDWRAFATGMVLAELPYVILSSSCFFGIFYFSVGLSGIGNRIAYFYIMYNALTIFAMLFGQAVASWTPNDVVASMVNPIPASFMALFSGVTIPYAEMPTFWR